MIERYGHTYLSPSNTTSTIIYYAPELDGNIIAGTYYHRTGYDILFPDKGNGRGARIINRDTNKEICRTNTFLFYSVFPEYHHSI